MRCTRQACSSITRAFTEREGGREREGGMKGEGEREGEGSQGREGEGQSNGVQRLRNHFGEQTKHSR